jgi:stearoyl-CoA desaturase (delta-9 desaturase)
MIMQTIAMENDIIEWVRDHRVHHKFSDTNADPHNSNRGFFFSHMGWLLCKKHPDVGTSGSKVDMSDVENEPVLQFQRKYYLPLVLLFSFIIPNLVSMLVVGHGFMLGICAIFCRYVVSLHLVWLTNSAAHVGSWKPYDRNIAPADSKFFGTICYGEGERTFF